MSFTNLNQDLDALPSVVDIDYHPLEGDYLKVSLISSFLINIIPLTALFVYTLIDNENLPYQATYFLIALFSFLLIFTLLTRVIGFRYKSFGLREHDIIYRSGWIWRNETIVPFNRIQHVEIAQGPLERRFNLAKLRIFTAGGSQSDLVIPGLYNEKANEIKAFLLEKTKTYV